MDALFADGLCIRPFRMRDAEAFACAVRESADTVGRWMPWCRADYSRRDARAWIAHCAVRLEMRVSYDVGIFSDDGEALYGGIAVNQIDPVHNMANIGYWVRASMQRQGVATRAVRAVAPCAFNNLKLTRLEIIAAEDNVASRAVAEKVGARFECIARNRLMIRGTPVAAAVYSLVPGDL